MEKLWEVLKLLYPDTKKGKVFVKAFKKHLSNNVNQSHIDDTLDILGFFVHGSEMAGLLILEYDALSKLYGGIMSLKFDFAIKVTPKALCHGILAQG
jgi:hypothetical protein